MGQQERSKSTGIIKTSQKLSGTMLFGCDIIKGTATTAVKVYDGGSNTANLLFWVTNTSAPTDMYDLNTPVAGIGNLWVEISGAQANAIIRYR
jgi:hypothetical protein